MDRLDINPSNRNWLSIILWWEIRRIPYNLIMFGIGYLSFYISYVTIPLVYILIGLWLNIIYTLGWVIEIIIIKNLNKNIWVKYPNYALISYIILSILFVFGLAAIPLLATI